jgi:arylsulfatase A-like enzyme
MMTGHPFNPALTYPCYGSVVSRELGGRESMPPFVQIGTSVDARFGGGVAGFLGDQFNPFVLPGDPSSPSFSVRDVTLPGGVDTDRFRRRLKALETVDTWQAHLESSAGAIEATDTFYQKAFELITSPRAKKAFNLHAEDPRLRDRYGRTALGQGCLLARRLIESGVRFVTVTNGGWDTHQNNFRSLRDRLLPALDAALSSLLQDLSDRGQLDSTLVVCISDFGRTPKVNPSAGRDHWSTASVALLAGGGLKAGQTVGRTNALAEMPIEALYYTEDLAATIYHRLGIPLSTTHQTPDGRPVKVNDEGRLIRELI